MQKIKNSLLIIFIAAIFCIQIPSASDLYRKDPTSDSEIYTSHYTKLESEATDLTIENQSDFSSRKLFYTLLHFIINTVEIDALKIQEIITLITIVTLSVYFSRQQIPYYLLPCILLNPFFGDLIFGQQRNSLALSILLIGASINRSKIYLYISMMLSFLLHPSTTTASTLLISKNFNDLSKNIKIATLIMAGAGFLIAAYNIKYNVNLLFILYLLPLFIFLFLPKNNEFRFSIAASAIFLTLFGLIGSSHFRVFSLLLPFNLFYLAKFSKKYALASAIFWLIIGNYYALSKFINI